MKASIFQATININLKEYNSDKYILFVFWKTMVFFKVKVYFSPVNRWIGWNVSKSKKIVKEKTTREIILMKNNIHTKIHTRKHLKQQKRTISTTFEEMASVMWPKWCTHHVISKLLNIVRFGIYIKWIRSERFKVSERVWESDRDWMREW